MGTNMEHAAILTSPKSRFNIRKKEAEFWVIHHLSFHKWVAVLVALNGSLSKHSWSYTNIDYWGIGHDVISTWEYQYWPRRSQGQYWYHRSRSYHVQCLNSQQLFYYIISLKRKKQQQNLGYGLCFGQSWISFLYMMTNLFHSVKAA